MTHLLQQFPEFSSLFLVSDFRYIHQFAFKMLTAHCMEHVLKLLVGRPEIMHCYSCKFRKYAHFFHSFLSALFLYGVKAPRSAAGAMEPVKKSCGPESGFIEIDDIP